MKAGIALRFGCKYGSLWNGFEETVPYGTVSYGTVLKKRFRRNGFEETVLKKTVSRETSAWMFHVKPFRKKSFI